MENMMLRVILIDDEPAATQSLKRMLKSINQVLVIGCYNDAKEGIQAICQFSPDIVFMDIEMPIIDGFMAAKATEHIDYHLVFVTAYMEHALSAFDTKVVDYLLKPIRPIRLTRCIDKINQFSNKQFQSGDTGISIYDGITRHQLTSSDISYIESIGRYQQVNLTSSGKRIFSLNSIITEESMTDFEEQLDTHQFMRIHRSYIINVTMAYQFKREARNMMVKLYDVQKQLPVARSKVGLLKDYLTGCVKYKL